MSKNLLLIAACLIGAALVLAIVFRPHEAATPIVIHADGSAASAGALPPAKPAEPDTDLAKNSPDPALVSFISSFRDSSIASCKTSLGASLQTTSTIAPDKIDGICACASERVIGTITVGEARQAAAGSMATNPTVQTFKARFADAGKACIDASLAH